MLITIRRLEIINPLSLIDSINYIHELYYLFKECIPWQINSKENKNRMQFLKNNPDIFKIVNILSDDNLFLSQ